MHKNSCNNNEICLIYKKFDNHKNNYKISSLMHLDRDMANENSNIASLTLDLQKVL
jgi:hypothetical protein